MVDQELEKKDIAESVLLGLIIGTTISQITRSPLLITISASIASLILIKSLFVKERDRRVTQEEESTLEPTLFQLSQGLREGISPERAFHLCTYPESENSHIIHRIDSAMKNGQPLSEVLSKLASQVASEGERRILLFLADSLSKDSRKAGGKLLRALERIRKNRELRDERTITIRSLLFRVKVLSVTCTVTLALIVSLLPILQWMTINGDWPQTAFITKHPSPWTAAIVLSLTSGISSYCAADVALAERPIIYAISSIIIFWTVFFTASQFVY